ncbi:MAG: hypothetical protein R3C14_27095 [Caldilineaceae bacterium]
MNSEKDKTSTVAEKTTKATEKARADAQQTAQTAKEKAGEMADTVQAKANEWTTQAKAKGEEVTQELKSKAQSTFEQQKNQTADQVQHVASALRQSSQELRSNDQETLAQYADAAAEQVEHFSSYVRSKSMNDVVHDVRALAHRQPELFVASMLAGGFLLGRFFKSSERSPASSQYRSDQYPRYQNGGNTYRGSAYQGADQAYADYYESRQQSYPAGEYQPVAGSATYSSSYGQSESAKAAQTEHDFRGGATAFNGERSTSTEYQTGQGRDPAVTGADWGADYQTNEYGQTTPAAETQDRKQDRKEDVQNSRTEEKT